MTQKHDQRRASLPRYVQAWSYSTKKEVAFVFERMVRIGQRDIDLGDRLLSIEKGRYRDLAHQMLLDLTMTDFNVRAADAYPSTTEWLIMNVHEYAALRAHATDAGENLFRLWDLQDAYDRQWCKALAYELLATNAGHKRRYVEILTPHPFDLTNYATHEPHHE